MHSHENLQKTHNLACLTKWKLCQNEENQQTANQNLISSESSQDKSACQISEHSIHAIRMRTCRNPEIRSVSLSEICAKMRKMTRPWPKSNQFRRCSGYISIPNSRLFLSRILVRMYGNPKFDQFHKVFWTMWVTLTFHRWPWKSHMLFPPAKWMFSKKNSWNLSENFKRYCHKKCDGQTDMEWL